MAKKKQEEPVQESKKEPEILNDKEMDIPTEEIYDIPEEIKLQNLVGRVLILKRAEIDQLPQYSIIHLVFEDNDGNEILARTTGKAILGTIKRLEERGLGKGKKFRVCIQMTPSGKPNPTILLVHPSLCEKK